MDRRRRAPLELLLPSKAYPLQESKEIQLGLGRYLPQRCHRRCTRQFHESRHGLRPLRGYLKGARRQPHVSR